MSIVLDQEGLGDGDLGEEGDAKEENDLSNSTEQEWHFGKEGVKGEGDEESSKEAGEHPGGEEHLVAEHEGNSVEQTNELGNKDRVESIPGKETEHVHGEHCAGLSEKHELGELPADDEEGGGHGDGEQVEPGGPQAPSGDADGKYLSQAEGEGKALPEWRRPHHPRRLPVVVEEADDREEATGERSREEVAEDEEEDGGEAGHHPDHPDVEVGRVSAPLAALYRLETLASVDLPALLREQPHRVEASVEQACCKLWVKVEPLEGVDGERELREVVSVQLLNPLTHAVSSHQHLQSKFREGQLNPPTLK